MRSTALALLFTAIGLCAVSLARGDDAQEAYQPRTPLAVQAMDAKDSFVPITKEQVAASLADLKSAVAALQQKLAGTSDERREGWNRYLMLNELAETINSDDPDLLVISQAGKKFTGPHPGLELPAYVNVRRAINPYFFMRRVYEDKRMDEKIALQHELLAKTLDQHDEQPSSETANTIGSIIGVLHSARQSPELVKAVRAKFDKPNVVVRLSAPFIEKASRTPFQQSQPVNQFSDGAATTGIANTAGAVRISPVQSEGPGRFELCLEANIASQTTTKKGPATVCISADTPIAAWREIEFDRGGFSVEPVSATAQTFSRVDGVHIRPRILSGIVVRKANQARPAGERDASNRARTEISEMFQKQTDEAVAKLNEAYSEKVIKPLIRRDQLSRLFYVQTTDTAAWIGWLQSNDQQIGASDPAPLFKTAGDIAVAVHESAMRNAVTSMLGGETLDRERFKKLIARFDPAAAQRMEEEAIDDEKELSITLDSRLPLLIDIRDGKMAFAINVYRFTEDGQRRGWPMRISTSFEISQSGDGIQFVRNDPVAVDFPYSKKLSIAQVGVRGRLQKKLDEAIPIKFVTKGLEPPADMKQLQKLGRLRVVDAAADNGWLQIGWVAGK